MHSEKQKAYNNNHKQLIKEKYDDNGNIMLVNKRKKYSNLTKCKTKKDFDKEPLPMKLRALPTSFWQQPNHPARQSPGEMCPDLTLLCKDDVNSVSTGQPIGVKPSPPPSPSTTPANTDLLFSLFRVVDVRENTRKSTRRRSRPRKSPSNSALRDADPCLVSAETPLLVGDKDNCPEIKRQGNYSSLLAELVVKL